MVSNTHTKTELVVIHTISRCRLLLVSRWCLVEIVRINIYTVQGATQMRLVLRRSFVDITCKVTIRSRDDVLESRGRLMEEIISN